MTDVNRLREEWKRILNSYSPEELVLKEPDEYLSRLEELSQGEYPLRELAGLYSDVIFISNYSFVKSNEGLLDLSDINDLRSIEDSMCALIFNCMVESTHLHSERILEKEDLLTIEQIVDKIPFKKMKIKGKEEFDKFYCRFKEYCLEVFVGEK
ncbi:Uncharacterised protein [uncultured archaeon]|nr:Uncharacterised protein [uncultured archaeon]